MLNSSISIWYFKLNISDVSNLARLRQISWSLPPIRVIPMCFYISLIGVTIHPVAQAKDLGVSLLNLPLSPPVSNPLENCTGSTSDLFLISLSIAFYLAQTTITSRLDNWNNVLFFCSHSVLLRSILLNDKNTLLPCKLDHAFRPGTCAKGGNGFLVCFMSPFFLPVFSGPSVPLALSAFPHLAWPATSHHKSLSLNVTSSESPPWATQLKMVPIPQLPTLILLLSPCFVPCIAISIFESITLNDVFSNPSILLDAKPFKGRIMSV